MFILVAQGGYASFKIQLSETALRLNFRLNLMALRWSVGTSLSGFFCKGDNNYCRF